MTAIGESSLTTQSYCGPAGVTFTSEELLILWKLLCLNPTGENATIRYKIKQFLERDAPSSTGR